MNSSIEDAWDAAMQALEKGDIKEAERLLNYMAPNEVKMMLRRIAEKQERASCRHLRIHEGPRVPMRWGTGPTDVCDDCGAYRVTLHTIDPWKPGPVPTEDDYDE